MHPATILLIEDEASISQFITAILTANDYQVVHATTGKEGVQLFSSHNPDLILLDLGLPDMDGMDVLHAIRAGSRVPIIVVSAREHESQKVQALDAGADDYIVKPFGTSELLARIRTSMRHAQYPPRESQTNQQIQTGDLLINLAHREVTRRGEPIHLTPNEYKIMTLLGQNLGKVLTHDYLTHALWGSGSEDNHTLRVHMANLRRKIEDNPGNPEYITTEVGVGYRLLDKD